MTQQETAALSWCLAAGLLAALLCLLWQRTRNRSVRERVRLLEDSVGMRDQEVAHTASTRLPALLESLHHPSAPVPGLRHDRLVGSPFATDLASLLEAVSNGLEGVRASTAESAKAALKSSVRTLQGLAGEQQLAISKMQERYDRPDVLQDLLEIDHLNAQLGRRAQAITVLCGSWPGRQRAASPLVDVVRGAVSRIRDYRRIKVNSEFEMGVVSRAVEPVVLAVAELLDNAARHSHPDTQVQVEIKRTHNGAALVIDDAGVGLREEQLASAAALLSGTRRNLEIADVGDPPQFGFVVIGALAARYGFTVSVDTRSPFGGLRAVLFLPSELLTSLAVQSSSAPTPIAAPSSLPSLAPVLDEAGTVEGLPRRRRRQPEVDRGAPRSSTARDDLTGRPTRSVDSTAAMLNGFARGTRAGRSAGNSAPGSHEEQTQ
ncbi:ATP-binding protein [Streptomyces flaveolus]|uniref:ATP-binding protein n=1 Tax=Streptomyces flaveolus TaxID=67297 RepID=UPI0036F81B8F